MNPRARAPHKGSHSSEKPVHSRESAGPTLHSERKAQAAAKTQRANK